MPQLSMNFSLTLISNLKFLSFSKLFIEITCFVGNTNQYKYSFKFKNTIFKGLSNAEKNDSREEDSMDAKTLQISSLVAEYKKGDTLFRIG